MTDDAERADNLDAKLSGRSSATSDDREEALAYIRHENLWSVLEIEVAIATRSAMRRFREYITAEDTEQVLWEWVMRAPKKIMRWHQEKNEEGFTRVLGAVLYDEATYFGRKTKAERLGYRLGDEFYYTKGMLRKLLPSVYNREDWINLPAWAQNESAGRSGKALNEGFGWVATLADVSRALSRLPMTDQLVLFERFGLDKPVKGDVPATTANGRVESSLKRLFDGLGGPRWLSRAEDREPDDGRWPAGRRKAMSNAQARYLTAKDGGA